ncbi:tyrosine-type recombinase/integrase [Caminibacter sp.]
MFENYNISMFNRNGKLYIQYFLDGKIKQKSTRLPDTPKNRKLVQTEVIPQLLLKLKSGEVGIKTPKKFDYYASIYLRQKESLKTYQETYNIVVNQLYPVFGKNTRVDKISRADIREWIDKKLLEITPKRMRMLIGVLKGILDIAIEYEHIEKNPAENIKLPAHKPKRLMKPFTPDEVKLLIENADEPFKNLLAFLFYTGVRTGEALAVTWSDIDFENMYIHINKSKRHGKTTTPKTKNSIRKVPIFKSLLPYLQRQFELSQKYAKTLSVFYNPRTKKGYFGVKHIHPEWKRLLNKIGMDYRVIYNTRHTFAINMIRAGVNIADVSQMLGHSNIRETLESYAKFLPEEYLKIKRDIDPFTDNPTDSAYKIPKFGE